MLTCNFRGGVLTKKVNNYKNYVLFLLRSTHTKLSLSENQVTSKYTVKIGRFPLKTVKAGNHLSGTTVARSSLGTSFFTDFSFFPKFINLKNLSPMIIIIFSSRDVSERSSRNNSEENSISDHTYASPYPELTFNPIPPVDDFNDL